MDIQKVIALLAVQEARMTLRHTHASAVMLTNNAVACLLGAEAALNKRMMFPDLLEPLPETRTSLQPGMAVARP